MAMATWPRDMVDRPACGLSDSAPAGPGLRMQIDEANRAIRAKAAEPGMNAMGATVVAVMIQNGAATIAWVGDCRAYLWRRAELRLLTQRSHGGAEMVDQGLLRADRAGPSRTARRHPCRRRRGTGRSMSIP